MIMRDGFPLQDLRTELEEVQRSLEKSESAVRQDKELTEFVNKSKNDAEELGKKLKSDS